MASHLPATPAFGKADLSNCEREQIHLAASVQPHGALLLLTEPDLIVVQASDNAAAILGEPGHLLGRSLASLAPTLLAQLPPVLAEPLHPLPVALRCRMGHPERDYDVLLHRPEDGGLVMELERAVPAMDLTAGLGRALQAVLAASALRPLCDDTARLFKDMTGYDRVMVYRFDEEGHGEVIAEQREPALEAFLGNRYPASDIPQIARRLYMRNRVRLLPDVRYTPVPLTPRQSPISGQDLDMSMCGLRSMSPIHAQYLQNMGVAGTLVASLVVGGRLWGLVACHHYVPRVAPFEVRAACEVLAEAVATRIAALESFVQGQAETVVRRLEQRLVEAVSRDGDWRTALFDSSQSMLQAMGAAGVALLFDGQTMTAGEVPATHHLREIAGWLDRRPPMPVLATPCLPLDVPDFAGLRDVASGLAAVRVSNSPGDYLVWFRPERVRTVTWGGNPFKPAGLGDDPSVLSPRRSFAQWHQLVEGTSEPWTPSDLNTARQIGATVSDVVLQFRSVRLLIAQDQFEQVRGQVRSAVPPTVIADPNGRLLLVNEAFAGLLHPGARRPQRIDDLPALFQDPDAFRDRMRGLQHRRQNWRGEVRLEDGLQDGRPLMLRADAVVAGPGRLLGYVLLFTDLTEHKAAEAARRRFQNHIVKGHRVLSRRLDSSTDLMFQNLLSAVIENAQLAGLEITDGLETPEMAAMLEGVRVSVGRTAEILQHLLWHARSDASSSTDRAVRDD